MSKQEYDANGYPIDNMSFTAGLKWAALGLFVLLPATVAVTLVVMWVVQQIFG